MDRHSWDERYEGGGRQPPLGANTLLVGEIGGLAPGRALDLACGAGRHARWLAAAGWRVVAVDFSVTGVSRARRAAAEEGVEVDWLVADVHTLVLPAGTFDLVVTTFFHPRPPERDHLYGTVAATLRPGGTFVQVSYDRANLGAGVPGPQDPDVLVDPAEVAGRLQRLGLVVTRADSVVVRMPGPDGEGEVDVVDAVVAARRPA